MYSPSECSSETESISEADCSSFESGGLEASPGGSHEALGTTVGAAPIAQPVVQDGWTAINDDVFVYREQLLPTVDVDRGRSASELEDVLDPEKLTPARVHKDLSERLENKATTKAKGVKDESGTAPEPSLSQMLARKERTDSIKIQTDDDLLRFADLVGISMKAEHLDGCLLEERPSAGGQTLRRRMYNFVEMTQGRAKSTIHKYVPDVEAFIRWLHLRHPECFRLTPQGATVPLVPRQTFAQYLHECSSTRFEAYRLHTTRKQIRDKLAAVRCLLAPTGSALKGLARLLKQSAREATQRMVEALFESIEGVQCLLRHLGLDNILTVCWLLVPRVPMLYAGPCRRPTDRSKDAFLGFERPDMQKDFRQAIRAGSVWGVFSASNEIFVGAGRKRRRLVLQQPPFNGFRSLEECDEDARAFVYLASVVQHKVLDTELIEKFTNETASDNEDLTCAAWGAHEWLQLCAAQELLRLRAGNDGLDITGFTPYDTAGWILLCLQFRKQHVSFQEATEESITQSAVCCTILQTALDVTMFGDLRAICVAASASIPSKEAMAAVVSAIYGDRQQLVTCIEHVLDQLISLGNEEGLRTKVYNLSTESIDALQCEGLSEADSMLASSLDAGSDLLSCMMPSDYARLRGQVTVCNSLMASTPVGGSNGFRFAFNVESEKEFSAGGAKYFAGVRSALVWLRDQIWQMMFEEAERSQLMTTFAGSLGEDTAFSNAMSITVDKIKQRMEATGDPSSQQKMLATLPTFQENAYFVLRGFGAGCLRLQDQFPTHPSAVAPACMNELELVDPDIGEAINSTFHQAAMLAPGLLRGDESGRLPLVALSTHQNLSVSPLPLEAVQVDVQFAKTNRGDKVDNRLLAYHTVISMCPLLHMALHFWAKLNPQGGSAPFQWADIISGEWQVYQVLDTNYPMGPFAKGTANVARLSGRIKKMNEHLYGRYNIGKVVHLLRRLGAELMVLAGVSETDLRRCGGWNKVTAMELHYMTSASPNAACAAAGCRGRDDYCPAHKYAEPSDALINAVFGVVLIIPDPMTGEERGLNVDEAILACKEHHDSKQGQGVSAAPLFETLRLLAKALLQAMPKIRELWPAHWIFHSLPLMSNHHPQHERYCKWERFQFNTCNKVINHIHSQKRSGSFPKELEPYVLDENDIRDAHELGPDVFGRWNFEAKLPQAASDPCVHTALLQTQAPQESSTVAVRELSFSDLDGQLASVLASALAMGQAGGSKAEAALAFTGDIARAREQLRLHAANAGEDMGATALIPVASDPRLVTQAMTGVQKELSYMRREGFQTSAQLAFKISDMSNDLTAKIEQLDDKIQAVQQASIAPARLAIEAGPSAQRTTNAGNDGSLSARQIEHVFNFGKKVSQLGAGDGIRLIMTGLTTRDGCEFPALGLRGEGAMATSCSNFYKNAITAVMADVEACGAAITDSAKLEQDLLNDPVMATASAVVPNGKPWVPAKGVRVNPTKLRGKRKEVWVLCIETTIFRVLSTWNIALHGLQLPSACDIQNMPPTLQGQIYAAEYLADQFASGKRGDGSGCLGIGTYLRNVSTSTGSQTNSIPHKTRSEQLISVPRHRYKDPNKLVKATPVPAQGTSSGMIMPVPAAADKNLPQSEPVVGETKSSADRCAQASMCKTKAVQPEASCMATSSKALLSPVAAGPPIDGDCSPAHRVGASMPDRVATELAASGDALRETLPSPGGTTHVHIKAEPLPKPRQASRAAAASVDVFAAFQTPGLSDHAQVQLDKEDAHLTGIRAAFESCVAATNRMIDLCILAVSWVHASIEFKDVSYKPLGLGNSGSALPPAWMWVKTRAPELTARLESCPEFMQGLPCFSKKGAAGRKTPSDFLTMTKPGEFHSGGGLRQCFKVLRPAFMEVCVLHVLRVDGAEPPSEYGWHMHHKEDPTKRVPWDWSLVIALASIDEKGVPLFSNSVRLWAALLTGEAVAGQSSTWYSWLQAQLEQQPGDFTRALSKEICLTICSTRRHSQPAKSKSKVKGSSLVKATAGVRHKPQMIQNPGFEMPTSAAPIAKKTALIGFDWSCIRSPSQLYEPYQWVCTQSEHPGDAVATQIRHHVVTWGGFQLCGQNISLGDEVINAYVLLLQEHDDALSSRDDKRARSLFWNSHFYAKLSETPKDSKMQYCYDNVRRWRAKEPGSIESLHRIFVPVHVIDVQHWVLAVIQLNFDDPSKPAEIRYIDSLGANDAFSATVMDNLITWVGQEWLREKHGLEAAVSNDTTTLPNRLQEAQWKKTHAESPRQYSEVGGPGVDCGVFTMMAMKRTFANRELDYDQHQVTTLYRPMCTLECAALQLHDIQASFPAPLAAGSLKRR